MKVFSGPLVFDGTTFFEADTVLIEERHVIGINDQIPPGAEVIDGSGMTLLPGFIDAHVHLGFFDPTEVLAGGVTAARDTGWPASEIFALTSKLQQDPTAGPYLLATGPMVTAEGGYPTRAEWAPRGTGIEVGDESQVRDAVTDLISRGAKFIKVAQEPHQGPVMSLDVLGAVVAAAHAEGVRVTSHCGSLDQLKVAITCGVDELAHGLWSDESIPDDVIDAMVVARMTVVPTMHIDPSDQRVDNLRRFAAAGGHVIYGTDMGNAGPPPGTDVAELKLMMSAGLALEDALSSATARSADYLGLEGRGRIVNGAIADLVLVKGDPRRDVEVLSHPVLVMREGT